MIKIVIIQPAIKISPRVNARRCMPLNVDMVARLPILLTAPKMVETDVIQSGRTGEGTQMASYSIGPGICVSHHCYGIPPNERTKPPLDVFIARKPRLVIWCDCVDIGR